jgi:hypothetical protein
MGLHNPEPLDRRIYQQEQQRQQQRSGASSSTSMLMLVITPNGLSVFAVLKKESPTRRRVVQLHPLSAGIHPIS